MIWFAIKVHENLLKSQRCIRDLRKKEIILHLIFYYDDAVIY